jgi:hypothetical protein
MIRYLLGELPEQEQIQLEEQYFGDDDWFEQLLASEEELIDDYVQGLLSQRERERFEKYFLTTPQRRERVEFAKTLQRYAAEEQKESAPAAAAPSPQPERWWRSVLNFLLAPHPVLQPAFAMAVVVLMLGSSWLFVQTMRLQDQLAQFEMEQTEELERRRSLQQQTDEQREQSRELASELENAKRLRLQLEEQLAKAPLRQPATVSFALSAGALRDIEGAKRLAIPRGAEMVQLQPDFDDDGEYKSYRAVLKTAEGEEVWSQGMLQARTTDAGKTVLLNVPALVFGENDYILTLIGVTADKVPEVVESYSFSVIKK